MNAFQTAKLWAVDTLHLGKDALHVYVGLILFLGSAALFRWQLKSWKPWAVVAVAAVAGEAWDMFDRARLDVPQFPWGNRKDVWNTLFWPTALTLLARYTVLLRH